MQEIAVLCIKTDIFNIYYSSALSENDQTGTPML